MSALEASSAAYWRVPPWRNSARGTVMTQHPSCRARSAVPSSEEESRTKISEGCSACACKLVQSSFQMPDALKVGIARTNIMNRPRLEILTCPCRRIQGRLWQLYARNEARHVVSNKRKQLWPRYNCFWPACAAYDARQIGASQGHPFIALTTLLGEPCDGATVPSTSSTVVMIAPLSLSQISWRECRQNANADLVEVTVAPSQGSPTSVV